MAVLIEKGDPFFDLKKARQAFEDNLEDLDDCNGFEWLYQNSRFFNVYNHGYVGSVFVYEGVDGKKYIGGFAIRKQHKAVVDAIIKVTELFDEVYAQTRHLNAVISLKEAGFKWFDRQSKMLVKTNK